MARAQVCGAVSAGGQFNSNTNLGGANDGGATPFTYTYAVGAGVNRLLVLAITYENQEIGGPGNDFAAVTYGGQLLTRFATRSITTGGQNTNWIGLFFLKDAGIAAAIGNTVSISFAQQGTTPLNYSIQGIAVNSILFENVNQTTPITDSQSASGLGVTSIAVPAQNPVVAGDMMLSIASSGSGSSNFTESAGYTMFNDLQIPASHTHAVAYRAITAAGFEQPGFTVTPSANRVIQVSVRLRQDASGLNCSTVLPVTLARFSAEAAGPDVRLGWETSSESGVAYFSAERSRDGRDFMEVGRVQPRGAGTYSLLDARVDEGLWYYRLRIRDYDGSEAFSAVVPVRVGEVGAAGAELSVYPVPARDVVFVETPGISSASRASCEIVDLVSGRVLRRLAVESAVQVVPLEGLAAGMYALRVQDAGGEVRTRLFTVVQ